MATKTKEKPGAAFASEIELVCPTCGAEHVVGVHPLPAVVHFEETVCWVPLALPCGHQSSSIYPPEAQAGDVPGCGACGDRAGSLAGRCAGCNTLLHHECRSGLNPFGRALCAGCAPAQAVR